MWFYGRMTELSALEICTKVTERPCYVWCGSNTIGRADCKRNLLVKCNKNDGASLPFSLLGYFEIGVKTAVHQVRQRACAEILISLPVVLTSDLSCSYTANGGARYDIHRTRPSGLSCLQFKPSRKRTCSNSPEDGSDAWIQTERALDRRCWCDHRLGDMLMQRCSTIILHYFGQTDCSELVIRGKPKSR